jgi:dTDP-glucose 4,6-dehydratase
MRELEGVQALVTGGAGFIGSELVRQLCDNGANVSVFDNFSSGKIEYLKGLNVKIIRGSIPNKEDVKLALKDQEIVFHLAAFPFIPDCYSHPLEFFRVNTMGTVYLMWGAIHAKSVEKFIHVSSSEVYGTAKYTPMDENHPTLPHSTYAVSKLAAERVVFSLHKEHDFPAVIIRPFNSFGPRITQPYIIPEIIMQLLKGNSIRLGNVKSSRDFTYVSDTARGIALAAVKRKAVGETINLGSGKDIEIKNLIYLIGKLLMNKSGINIVYDKSRLRPYDVNRLICDNSKAQKLLGWKPEISMEEGLRKTITWIKNNPVKFKRPFRGWPRALKAD